MAVSQLKIYSSSDSSAPILNGTSGSLVELLDACLVNGYGSKSGLGWLKPLPNDNNRGCWQQSSGSGMTLFVNDAAPTNSVSVGGGTRDAFATGYESLSELTGSITGTGNGQFPYYGLNVPVANGGIPFGAVVWRKSLTQDTVQRFWILFGDATTFYLFIQPGDTVGQYAGMGFGDIFSTKPTYDAYKCIIFGRAYQGAMSYGDDNDCVFQPTVRAYNTFFARGFGGQGMAVEGTKMGDVGKSIVVSVSGPAGSLAGSTMLGIIPVSNPTDNSLYMSPIQISETATGNIRGRIRGMYHLCHPLANFGDGQVFSGANEYAGKTFQIVKQGYSGGFWVIEISPTVETNL